MRCPNQALLNHVLTVCAACAQILAELLPFSPICFFVRLAFAVPVNYNILRKTLAGQASASLYCRSNCATFHCAIRADIIISWN